MNKHVFYVLWLKEKTKKNCEKCYICLIDNGSFIETIPPPAPQQKKVGDAWTTHVIKRG